MIERTQAEQAMDRQLYRMIRRALQTGRDTMPGDIDKRASELQNYHSIITDQAINAVISERLKARSGERK
ncbi:hypothetical protein JUN65_01955 [Gluconacetobacter azotocaptans]|uniref:hypothetical protein n=1 Tax=Gluconacetobacter azotocaptans TaxID=142834 RepID=UPI00195B1F99|nr:hypothetical protein [Gluconacetobacter azotocaptans]MBM9400357.1 hypothetical protein [Gluconacetobacter azotocaptans]